MSMTPEQEAQVKNALNPGIQLALPQTVLPVTKKQTQVQRTQYDPEKLQALKDALNAKRSSMTGWEAFANGLKDMQTPQAFTGGFGEQIINPWAVGLSNFARGFGNAYSARKESEREAAEKEREDAIKAAQLDAEATKSNITNIVADDYIKYNDPKAKTPEQLAQEDTQKKAAVQALKDLEKIADDNKISAWNNEADSSWNSASTAKTLGVREQALSALIPLTNSIARASGGSGINTVGEMLAYLGVPENATSRQLQGVLPGLVRKLGLEEDFYQQTPTKKTAFEPLNIDGYTVEIE